MPAVSYKTFKYLVLFFLIAPSLVLVSKVYADLVNINTAGSVELQTLNGIGPTYAQRIIDYRNASGSFQTIEEIKNVSGIGDVTFEKIKDYITVGIIDSTADDENDNTISEAQSGVNSSSSSSGSDNAYSVKKVFLDTGAGKSKTAMVGTPVEFIAEVDGGRTDNFEWHFGDGALAHGAIVTHAYNYAGEYAVVLSVSDPRGTDVVVVRTSVKVIDPNVVLSDATQERIEITNKTSSEIDLFGRVLVVDGKMFAFPRYTLILPGQRISFSGSVTGLRPKNLSEVYLLAVGDNPFGSTNGMMHGEKSKLEQIAMIQKKISELEKSLATARQYTNSLTPQVAKEQSVINNPIATTTLTANALSAVSFNGNRGWFEKLKRFLFRTE